MVLVLVKLMESGNFLYQTLLKSSTQRRPRHHFLFLTVYLAKAMNPENAVVRPSGLIFASSAKPGSGPMFSVRWA